jgi:chromosome segregation ATPase
MEQIAKDKESKFKEEQAAASRRAELNENVKMWQEEEKKVIYLFEIWSFWKATHLFLFKLSDQIAALRPKLRAKESEKAKQRMHSKDLEEKMLNQMNDFLGEVSMINNLINEIERSMLSQGDDCLAQLESKLENIKNQKDKKEQEIAKLEPDLQKIIRSINDHESHRRQIQANIEVIGCRQRLKELSEEMDEFRQQLKRIEGHSIATSEFNTAIEGKEQLLDQKARLEGRRGGYVDQVHFLKVRLDFIHSFSTH